jgi:predicted permease
MDTLLKDLGYAGRTLRAHLAFTIVAVATLTLGIGACTAIFSVVNAVLLRPLPYANSERLALVWGELRARHVPDWPFSPPDFADLRRQATDFEDLAGITPAGRVPISGDDGEPEQARVAAATTNVFRLLGARVIVGRDFIDADATPQPQPPPGAQPPPPGAAAPPRLPAMAILSHGFWLRRYGGDSSIIGRSIDFGGNGRATIIGVLAPGFEILFAPRANFFPVPDMWVAARVDFENANRNNVLFRVIGRLKPDVPFDRADAQVESVAADLRQHFPIKQTAGLHFHVVPMHDDLVRDVRPAILILMGAVIVVLLIACANVANLLVVRASSRSRELAIRAAIGGTRWRLVRQLLAESLLLALMGMVIGLALARAGIRALIALAPANLPRLDDVGLDPNVLTFTVIAGLITAVACGIVPALRASRPDLMDGLRQSGSSSGLRGGRMVRQTIVIVEVALSCVLLIAAALMVRSFVAVQRVNPGFDPNGVLTFLLPARGQQPAERAVFMRQVRDRLRALPGVRDVSAATPLPLDGQFVNGRWGPEAAASDPSLYRQADIKIILPGYFETLRTRLIAGRTFTDADNQLTEARLLVIDELLAARAFPNQSPQAIIGKRLLTRIRTAEAEPFEVIGIVAHQRHGSLAVDGPEAMFFSDGYLQHGAAAGWIVRADGDPTRLTAAIRSAVLEIDRKATLADVRPMSAFVDRALAPLRFAMLLIGIFGGVALVLASVGLYGVLSTVVRQRTAEIGVRMVFGAQRGTIFAQMIGEGLRLSAIGIIAGLIAAFAITRLLRSLLVGVTPTDPMTFATIAGLFLVIAALACWLPAQRAARVDPLIALREE